MNDKPWKLLVEGNLAGLAKRGGRYLVTGARPMRPRREGTLRFGTAEFDVVNGGEKLYGVAWKSVHFVNCDLTNLRWHHCQLDDCIFESSDCRYWRAWDTRLTDCAFINVDLRHSSLGGNAEVGPNSYVGTAFDRCDMRETVHFVAAFTNCIFSNANLQGVDFSGSRFEDCVFKGLLQNVQFRRNVGDNCRFPQNEMLRVDFRGADLRGVEFRGLDLERVAFPQDASHLIVQPARTKLSLVLAILQRRQDPISRALAADVEHVLNSLGDRQEQAVFSKADIRDFAGLEGLVLFERALAEADVQEFRA